jgi:hypothetical protein
MSGGQWGYQSDRLIADGERFRVIMEAVGKSERIIDWAESGDSSKEMAKTKLYELWVDTFTALYGMDLSK